MSKLRMAAAALAASLASVALSVGAALAEDPPAAHGGTPPAGVCVLHDAL